MCKAYRRKPAGRGTIVASLVVSGPVFLFMATLSVAYMAHVYGLAHEIAWPGTALGLSFAVLLLAGGVEALANLPPSGPPASQGPVVNEGVRPLARFTQKRRRLDWWVARYVLWIAGGAAMMLGSLGTLSTPHQLDRNAGLAAAAGAALCLLFGYQILSRFRKLAAPKTLAIDQRGIHASWSTPQLIAWPSVNLIHVDHDRHLKDFPETHRIELYGKRSQDRPKRIHRIGWSKWSRQFFFDRPLLRILPAEEFGVSPTAILEALERFRPPTLPIHDPRRIVDDGQK